MTTSILTDKTALITGATGGLGREITRKLAEAGCRLFLTARNESALLSLAGEITGGQNQVLYKTADLADQESVQTLAEDALERMGHVDILVNCAGVFDVLPLSESTDVVLERCLQINVKAPYVLSRAFAPGMVERGWGRIVNIGSSSAYSGFRNTSVYCASKHALLGMSRALHDELKANGVRVFCLSPGSIKTEMGRKVVGQRFETFLDPVEVADYVRYIISFNGALVSEEVRLNRVIIQ